MERAAPQTFIRFALGKYYVEELIGSGGMGEVFRASFKGPSGFKKEVALKRLHLELEDLTAATQAFEQEARIGGLLSHGNIVPVFDFFLAGNDLILVMDYIRGRSLGEVIREALNAGHPLSLPLSLYIISEVAKGLQYAHSRKDPETQQPLGLIHRDISPQNIFLTDAGEVKILDFGIAKFAGRPGGARIAGKTCYMSPEQAWGSEIDSRADIFSLGLVLFELLTGLRPYAANSVQASLELARAANIPPLASVAEFVPEDVRAVLTKALAVDVAERYQSVGAMQEHLQKALFQRMPHFSAQHALALLEPYHFTPVKAVQAASAAVPKPADLALSYHPPPKESATNPINLLYGVLAMFGTYLLLWTVLGTRASDQVRSLSTVPARPPQASIPPKPVESPTPGARVLSAHCMELRSVLCPASDPAKKAECLIKKEAHLPLGCR